MTTGKRPKMITKPYSWANFKSYSKTNFNVFCIQDNNITDQSMKKHVLNYQFKIYLLNIFSGHWPIGAPRPDKLPNIYFHPGGPKLCFSYLADIIFDGKTKKLNWDSLHCGYLFINTLDTDQRYFWQTT